MGRRVPVLVLVLLAAVWTQLLAASDSSAARPLKSPPPPLSVVTLSPLDGEQVSGAITWEVSVSGGTPSRVDFAIDGALMWTQTTAPYLYGGTVEGLDTTQLSDGAHTLTATAHGKGLKPGSSQVTVIVDNNGPPPEPPPPEPPAPELPATSDQVYWGAWIGPQLTGTAPPWDMTALAQFEEMVGKPVSVLHFGMPFAECSRRKGCSFYTFPWTPFTDIRAHGAIPFLSWSSQSTPSSTSEPNFQLSDVINGTYDSYIRSIAIRAAEWGHPFFLRFDWEMNGAWFPWSEQANGNAPGEYVEAWRHVHDIFASAGATNATWVWCPNVDPNGTLQSLGSLYPGDAYVDWTCLDGYNWGGSAWTGFYRLYNRTYREITETIAPGKPMLIGEIGSSENGGSKADWIRNMFAWLPTGFPKIRGLLWFEKYDSNMDWPIETSESSLNAFADGIAAPWYVPNEFGGLSTSPIPPPEPAATG